MTFFSSPKRPELFRVQPNLLLSGHPGPLSGLKQPGREFDYSPASSAKVKNGWR